MSQATGAPPPPPPPPPPNKKTSFEDLPTELLLCIVEFLRIGDYARFTLAVYPILECHGLVPPLTVDTFNRIANPQKQSLPSSSHGSRGPLWISLPTELNYLIMEYLEPADRIAFIFSHPDLFQRYFPPLSEETRMRLWNLIQRSEKR